MVQRSCSPKAFILIPQLLHVRLPMPIAETFHKSHSSRIMYGGKMEREVTAASKSQALPSPCPQPRKGHHTCLSNDRVSAFFTLPFHRATLTLNHMIPMRQHVPRAIALVDSLLIRPRISRLILNQVPCIPAGSMRLRRKVVHGRGGATHRHRRRCRVVVLQQHRSSRCRRVSLICGSFVVGTVGNVVARAFAVGVGPYSGGRVGCGWGWMWELGVGRGTKGGGVIQGELAVGVIGG